MDSSGEEEDCWPGCILTATGAHSNCYYSLKYMPHDSLCEFLKIPLATPISIGNIEKLIITYAEDNAGIERGDRHDNINYDKDLWALFELKETKVLKTRHLDDLIRKLCSWIDERKNSDYIVDHSYIFQSTPTHSSIIDNALSKSYPKEILYAPHSIPGHIQILKQALTKEECDTIVSAAETCGFHVASYQTDSGHSDIRKSQRCLIDSRQFVQRLADRLHSFLPQTFKEGTFKSIYDRLRILKYSIGDEFKPHKDGKTIDTGGSTSKLSLLIYLNDDYAGGQTEFMNNDLEWAPIVPETGMVVLYDQTLTHRVPPLTSGYKYVIRSELMYIESSKDEYKMFTIS